MNIVKLLLTASIILLPNSCATAQTNHIQGITAPDALVVALGEKNIETLFHADDVSYFILGNEPKESTLEPIPGYFRYNKGKTIHPDYISVLLFLLPGNPDNYITNENRPIIMAPFLPYQEFVFHKGKDSISLIVSTSDLSWAIAKNGEIVKKFPYVDKKSVERLLKGF